MKFFFFLLFWGSFIFNVVDATEIEKTHTGYSFELDAPSGNTKFVELTKNHLFDSASLKFQLTEKYNNPEWPPALNVRLENTEYKAILLWSLQKPFGEESFILETAFWVDGEKYPEPITVLTEYNDEKDMVISVAKVTTDEYTFSINGNDLVIIPFPVPLNKITIGLQSSSGTINVEIPNKDSGDGA